MFGIDLSAFFLSPGFALWFLLLIPLIILYLIRPKPVNQTIPSLMFLLQDKGRAIRNSFLRYLYRDFVFLLQLLIIALLIGAACEPFITVSKKSFIGNAVIVLDASASMQTDDGRWNEALDQAKASLARQNTIILVLNRPVVIAKDASKGDALDALKGLKPSDTSTNLYAAVIAARTYATSVDSVVTVISDFINTDKQQDVSAAIAAVRTTGATVKTVPVGGKASNVGIVSMDVEDDKTRIGVTNFDEEARTVTLKAGTFSQELALAAGATEFTTITTPAGVTEVTIDADDDFPLDDTATIANNENLAVKVLLVTNNPQVTDTPFYYALKSINDKTPLDITIGINNPPTLPAIADYDIIVFTDVNSQLLVQRVIRDTSLAVKQGKAAIIMDQDGLFGIDFAGMLPLQYEGAAGASGLSAGEFSDITNDIEFGDVQKYTKVSGTGRVLAQASDDSPVIVLLPFGEGRVLYYGIQETASSFPFEPYYPVFWKRVLDALGGRESLDALNYNTGEAPLTSALAPLKTPGNVDFSGFYDTQGVYSYADRTVAANLLTFEESRVSAGSFEDLGAQDDAALEASYKRKELTSLVILAVLALLFLELFIVKFRGDF